MTTIKLPPLPAPLRARIFDGMASVYSPDQVRARDLEVAKCVLEAAAKAFEAEVDTWDEMRKRGYSGAIRRKGATAIRALEFKHHE